MKIVILIEIIVINKIHYRFEPSYHLVEFVIVWLFCSVSSLFPCWPCSFMMVAHSVMVISYDYRNIRSWSGYWCRACYKLATQGTIFFFYLYMSFKKETEDRPIHKCHKNAQVRSKHQIVQDVVYLCTCLLYILLLHVPIFVYRIYIDTYLE